jgi:hypothetical protein
VKRSKMSPTKIMGRTPCRNLFSRIHVRDRTVLRSAPLGIGAFCQPSSTAI